MGGNPKSGEEYLARKVEDVWYSLAGSVVSATGEVDPEAEEGGAPRKTQRPVAAISCQASHLNIAGATTAGSSRNKKPYKIK